MWNLAKGEQFLPQTSLAALQQYYRQEPRAKPKVRLLAALHRKRGHSLDQIAQQLQRPRRTVHSWLVGFQKRGLAAKDLIAQRYEVSYRGQHVWRILRSLGFSLQRPRPRHPQAASLVQIARFKKKPAACAEVIESGALWWARKTRQPLV